MSAAAVTIFQGEFYIAITRAAQEHVVATFEESEDHKTLLVIDEKVRTNLFRELRLDDQTIVEAFSMYSEPTEIKTIFVAPSFDHHAKEFVAKHWGMLMFT
jgi:hypothetical protein